MNEKYKTLVLADFKTQLVNLVNEARFTHGLSFTEVALVMSDIFNQTVIESDKEIGALRAELVAESKADQDKLNTSEEKPAEEE